MNERIVMRIDGITLVVRIAPCEGTWHRLFNLMGTIHAVCPFKEKGERVKRVYGNSVDEIRKIAKKGAKKMFV